MNMHLKDLLQNKLITLRFTSFWATAIIWQTWWIVGLRVCKRAVGWQVDYRSHWPSYECGSPRFRKSH